MKVSPRTHAPDGRLLTSKERRQKRREALQMERLCQSLSNAQEISRKHPRAVEEVEAVLGRKIIWVA